MRRALVYVVAVAAAAAFLVGVGRWERRDHISRELAGMQRVLHAVGPLGGPSLDAYRAGLVPFDCLLYRRASNPYALELCIDASGRLVEALDRRSGTLHVWSLREEPEVSTIRVDRREVDRLLRRLGVPRGVNAGPRGQ